MEQSFNTENFVSIFYDENRKGNYIEGYFHIFAPLIEISKKIKQINKNFREKRYSTEVTKEKANRVKDKLRKKKFDALSRILQSVETNIDKNRYSISITPKVIKGKTAYVVDKTNPEIFFLLKQLQRNIQRSFKVKQSDRYEIVSQVINLLDNNFPKYVVRTDIKDFFESIPHDKLLEKIDKNHILSPASKKIIRDILRAYNGLTGLDCGIPRGIGISAYLSELYMRDIDNKIKAQKNLTYYARYVDDIVAIFTPNTKHDTNNYKSTIENIINDDSLAINLAKTKEFDLVDFTKKQGFDFDFLGFNIKFNNQKVSKDGTNKDINKVKVDFSHKKKRKYIKKIQYMIEDYNISSKYNEKNSRKMLINRLKYLTGNSRLLNVKKDILVGIYFSNILLNDTKSIEWLDKFLVSMIDARLQPYAGLSHIDVVKLKTKLKAFSFKDGFNNKKFYRYWSFELKKYSKLRSHEFDKMLQIWKTL